jgi:valyl-tRNA synthetase
MSLRAQAHDIIRTWAFYTILKSHHHFGVVPWSDIAVSGWGIAGEGMGKISKSRGGGPMPPQAMIDAYSADAIRYWAASTGLGKDAVISEQKILLGQKLVTKIWNVARFAAPFVHEDTPDRAAAWPQATLADRWIMGRLQEVIATATERLSAYEHAAAKDAIEAFFWTEVADNYLEMAKQRLYDPASAGHAAARFALSRVLLALLKLLAPFVPHVTECIYQELYATASSPSLHTSGWPVPDPAFEDPSARAAGQALTEIATAARRYKSEHGLSLATPLQSLEIGVQEPALRATLREARADLSSVTRAERIAIVDRPSPGLEIAVHSDGTRTVLPY